MRGRRSYPVFGRRSVEALDQPRWTRLFVSPLFLAGVSAALFTGAALRLDAAPKLAPGLLLCAVLVGVTAVDLRYRIIPNRVVLPAAAIGYGVSVALAPGRWLELLLAALIARPRDARRRRSRLPPASGWAT